MPTIGEIFVFCWVSLGPRALGMGGCVSVNIDIGYIMPTIGEIFVFSWVSLGPC